MAKRCACASIRWLGAGGLRHSDGLMVWQCETCDQSPRTNRFKPKVLDKWHLCPACGAFCCPSCGTGLEKPRRSRQRGLLDRSRVCLCGGLTRPVD